MWRGAGVAEPWGVQQWRSSDRHGGKLPEHWYEYRSEVLPQPYIVHISFLLARYGGRGDELARSRDPNAAMPPLPHIPYDPTYLLLFGHRVIGGAAALCVQRSALRVRVAHLEIPGDVFPVHCGCLACEAHSVSGVLSSSRTTALCRTHYTSPVA